MRAVLLTAAVLELLLFTHQSHALDMMTAKACNAELRQHKREIFKAGQSLQEFMEQCWSRSKPGQSISIRSRPAEPIATPSKIQKSADKVKPTIKPLSVRVGLKVRPRIVELIKPRSESPRHFATHVARKKYASRGSRQRFVGKRADVRPSRHLHYARMPLHYARTPPPGVAFNGDRGWVVPVSGRVAAKSAIVLRTGTVGRDAPLGCWNQLVLLWNARDGAREKNSTVCSREEAVVAGDNSQISLMRFVAFKPVERRGIAQTVRQRRHVSAHLHHHRLKSTHSAPRKLANVLVRKDVSALASHRLLGAKGWRPPLAGLPT